ncbi:MAG: NAD(P)H-hydrate epimerase, partial [Spirochaetes bacterium]|nr:NAD(P)H-hydrate epimerase [Spirochaetota bacterium]
MKVVTADEMRKIDSYTIKELGIPGETLMGYAGKSIADYISASFPDVNNVAIFSGTGNNGGDGFVIGYFLFNMNYNVDIFLSGNIEKVSETSRTYLNVCTNCDISIMEINNKNLYNIDINKYELIIDAMLGTGFSGEPRGIIREAIELINASGITTLSVDIPSGLP